MEGLLLIIGLILWFMKKGSKKKDAQTGFSSAAKLRAERAIRMHDAGREREEQRLAEQVSLFEPDAPVEHGEGEGMEHALRSGSLNVESSEGEDLCDPSLGHDVTEAYTPDSIYAGEIGREQSALDLSPHGIWQGIVMSEVLARPSQRLRRK